MGCANTHHEPSDVARINPSDSFDSCFSSDSSKRMHALKHQLFFDRIREHRSSLFRCFANRAK